jgi:hypothetical protein
MMSGSHVREQRPPPSSAGSLASGTEVNLSRRGFLGSAGSTLALGASLAPVLSGCGEEEATHVSHVFSKFGTYMLPQVYPEGSPVHPYHEQFAGFSLTKFDGTTITL